MRNLIKFPEIFKINKSDINTGKAAKHVYDIKKFLREREKKRQAQLFVFAHGLNKINSMYLIEKHSENSF